jgi:hypothetical protein
MCQLPGNSESKTRVPSLRVSLFQNDSRCLDVCAIPQLDTVTLRPTLSDTVTIRPMSCWGLATQLQLND